MFNLDNYEPVEERLAKWWKENTDGRISTELEIVTDKRFIVKAYLYRTFMDAVAYATGYAEETITDRGVNATSALENCETSAIGRALANAGYAAKGKRASREEMAKVTAHNTPQPWGVALPDSEPVSSGEAITQLREVLTTSAPDVAPNCNHMNGQMPRTLREGLTKSGRPYRMWACPEPARDLQCAPIWMELKNAVWTMPEGVI